jgi:nucleoside-diphosphate-sugar epimerase
VIVAVTGANGFIGRRLCERFERDGAEARPVTRADFANGAMPELVRAADVVVHAAGATRGPSIAELRESNVELTRRVVEAANGGGARRLVFISSQAAAGPAASRDAPVVESATAAPIEAYGASKLDAEEVVRRGCAMPWVTLRPASVYGPGDRDFFALFRLARRGIAVHPANRRQWISIVHVDDVVDTIVLAATSSVEREAMFVANDEPAQWSELFRLAASAAGRASPELAVDVELPSALVRAGAAVGDAWARVTGKAGLLTSRKVALSRPPFWVCSNSKAKQLLGFTPRVELRDGFVETFRWYRAQGWL